MPAVAALLDSRAAYAALRRTLLVAPPTVHACRSPAGLMRAYTTRLLEAVVVGVQTLRHLDLPALRARYPSVPVLVYGIFRPDDGALASALLERGTADALVVEGVDDAVVGDLVRRHAASRLRAARLAAAPRLLRLREPLQQAAWRRVVALAGRPVTTEEVADALGVSREHLSRQFAAGGAPNLKRVIDLLRVAAAADLLADPGYPLPTVARLLGFGSASHLHAMARRITKVPATGLASLGPEGVLAAFLKVGMRSRG